MWDRSGLSSRPRGGGRRGSTHLTSGTGIDEPAALGDSDLAHALAQSAAHSATIGRSAWLSVCGAFTLPVYAS